MTAPLCFRCRTVMVDDGPATLDQCDGPTLPAVRFVCPKCPEPVETTLPVNGPTLGVAAMRAALDVVQKAAASLESYGEALPIVYGTTRISGTVTYEKGTAA